MSDAIVVLAGTWLRVRAYSRQRACSKARAWSQVLAVANAVLAGSTEEHRLQLRPTRPDGPIPQIRSFPTGSVVRLHFRR